MLEPWEVKAHKFIASSCLASFERCNRLPNGRLRKRHVPYPVPEDAARLVDILGWQDRVAAEHEAKAMFIRHAFGAVNV